MKAAASGDSPLDFPEEVKFLTNLRACKKISARLTPPSDAECLIPNRLYYRTLEQGTSNNEISKYHSWIKAWHLVEDLKGCALAGTYKLNDASPLDLTRVIPGLAYGLLGMKEGETREIFIHPDLAYGTHTKFADGEPLKITVKLIELGPISEKEVFPLLNIIETIQPTPEIGSCSEFNTLQSKYDYHSGEKTWDFYKKGAPLAKLEEVLSYLALPHIEPELLQEEQQLFHKFEYLLYFSSSPKEAKILHHLAKISRKLGLGFKQNNDLREFVDPNG